MKKKRWLFLFLPLLACFSFGYALKETTPVVVVAESETNYPTLDTAEAYETYWSSYVRPTKETSICSMRQDLFEHLYQQYQIMETSEKEKLDTWKDIAGERVKDTLLYLNEHFHPVKSSASQENILTQDTTLTVIIVIAVFGVTSIGLFYVLKNQNVIE